jgi:hypothetical protein
VREARAASAACATQLELTILRNRYGPEGSLSLTC